MKVEGRSSTSRRSNHPLSYSSTDGDDAKTNNTAGRGPRRRRPGAKQEAPQQGSRKTAAAPKGTVNRFQKITFDYCSAVEGLRTSSIDTERYKNAAGLVNRDTFWPSSKVQFIICSSH